MSEVDYYDENEERASFGDAPELSEPPELTGEEQFRSQFKAIQRTGFQNAPEVVAADQSSKGSVEPVESQELRDARLQAAAWREQAEEAQEMIRDAHDAGLQRVVYESELDFSDRETAVALADAVLASGDSYRTQDYVSAWQEADPQMASQWIAAREAQATQAAIRADTEAARAELAQQATERANAIESWAAKHGDVAADFLASQALELGATPQDLEKVHEGLREADRAAALAQREAEIRQAFAEPRFADDFKRDRLGREAVPEVTEEDVAARMRPLADQRQAESEAKEAAFREAFADTARPRFGPGSAPR